MTSARGARRRAASSRSSTPDRYADIVDHARVLCAEWSAAGLSSEPADVDVAESSITELYRLSGHSPPDFVWTTSPAAAVDAIRRAEWTPSADVATLIGGAHRGMKARIRRHTDVDPFTKITGYEWWNQPVPPIDPPKPDIYTLLRRSVWDSMRSTLVDGVVTAVKRMSRPPAGLLTWYGQQEAYRVGFFSTVRDVDLVRYPAPTDAILDLHGKIVSSCGWWWAFDDVCVISDRPGTLRTEPLPGAVDGRRRLHSPDSAAIRYSDGHQTFALQGVLVPEWLISDPSVDRILDERNIEVRRLAVEQVGWDQFIDESGIRLLHSTDDPGNPGARLDLYETPERWSMSTRILLTVNGSVERDGTHRRYGIHVPGTMTDALDAAAWTYGLTGGDYATLLRRT